MSGVKVTTKGRIVIDQKAIVDAIAPVVVKSQEARTDKGLDTKDQRLPRYSQLYRKQLQAINADTDVDARESGGLMKSIHLLRVDVRNGHFILIFGPDNETTPRRPRPPPFVFAGTPKENAKALERWRRAPKDAARSLPNREKMRILQSGQYGGPPRMLQGVSPRARAEVIRALKRARIFRSK